MKVEDLFVVLVKFVFEKKDVFVDFCSIGIVIIVKFLKDLFVVRNVFLKKFINDMIGKIFDIGL